MSGTPQTSPEQQEAVGDRPTDWSQTLAFTQLDPSLGSLQAIGVGLTADVAGSVSVESLEAAPAAITATLTGEAQVDSPTCVLLASAEGDAAASAHLAAYDGTTNYAGPSGAVLALTGTGATAQTWQQGGVDLGDFSGTGSVSLSVAEAATLHMAGPANLQVSSNASGGALVSVQNGYQPSSGGQSGDSISGSGLTIVVPGNVVFGVLDGAVTTPSQTITLADRTTGWSDSVPITRFDPRLGSLEAVNLTLTGDIHGSVAAQNEDLTPSSVYTTQTVAMTLGSTLLEVAPSVSDGFALAAGAGRIDQGLTQTITTTGTLTDPTSLAQFIGQGQVFVPISTTGTSSLQGPGNLMARLLAQAGATVTVSYTYLPTGVSAASTFWTDVGGGLWRDGTNWSSRPDAPLPGADVAITHSGTYTVTLAAAASVHSVVIDAPGATVVLDANLAATGDFVLDAGTIEFNGGTISAGNFTVNGGLISGGTIGIDSAGTIAFNGGSVVAGVATLQAGPTVSIGPVNQVGSLTAFAVEALATFIGVADQGAAVSGITPGTFNLSDGSNLNWVPVLVQGIDPTIIDDIGSLTISAIDTVFGGSSGGLYRGTGMPMLFAGGTGGGATVVGGLGQNTLFGGIGGGNFLVAGTGATTIVGGGNGDFLLGEGSAGDRIYAGSGSESLAGSGAGADLLMAGSGNTLIFGGGGANTIVGGSGNSTVVGGAGADTVFAGTGRMLVFGGSSSLIFVGGASSANTVVGGAGATTLFGGSGGHNLFFAGSGKTIMLGGGDGDVLLAGGTAGDQIYAGGGNETLAGSSGGNDLLAAGTGSDVIFAGGGADTILAGRGSAQLVAGNGPDLFDFVNSQAGGTDVIWNFTAGADHVLLTNYGADAVANALASAVTSGSSTTITLSDNTRITFGNVTQLATSDFISA